MWLGGDLKKAKILKQEYTVVYSRKLLICVQQSYVLVTLLKKGVD